MNEQIAHLMKTLDLTEEEAREMLATDEAIDHGADPFPQTAEQKKASKEARATGTRAYTFTKRERKEDNDKRFLISALEWCLTTDIDQDGDNVNADNVIITNPERQIDFTYNNRHFRIVLSAPRTG